MTKIKETVLWTLAAIITIAYFGYFGHYIVSLDDPLVTVSNLQPTNAMIEYSIWDLDVN